MAVEIEGLEFQIEAKSDKAAKGIDALTASLSRLRNALKGNTGLSKMTKQLDTLSNVKEKFSGIEKN